MEDFYYTEVTPISDWKLSVTISAPENLQRDAMYFQITGRVTVHFLCSSRTLLVLRSLSVSSVSLTVSARVDPCNANPLNSFI